MVPLPPFSAMFTDCAYFRWFSTYFPLKMVPHPCYKLKHGTPSAVFPPTCILPTFCLCSAHFPLIFRLTFRSFSASPVLQGVYIMILSVQVFISSVQLCNWVRKLHLMSVLPALMIKKFLIRKPNSSIQQGLLPVRAVLWQSLSLYKCTGFTNISQDNSHHICIRVATYTTSISVLLCKLKCDTYAFLCSTKRNVHTQSSTSPSMLVPLDSSLNSVMLSQVIYTKNLSLSDLPLFLGRLRPGQLSRVN